MNLEDENSGPEAEHIKAITRITYTKDEPADYWAKRGYSRYDGI